MGTSPGEEGTTGAGGGRPGRHGPARLVLVGDHALVRAGLRSLFEEEPDLAVVGEAASAGAALAVCRRLRPDLVLLDLRLPEPDGLAAVEALKRELPETAVLVLSLSADPASALEAIRAGATGYLLKDAPLDELVDGVRAALAGELVLDPRIATRRLRRAAGERTGRSRTAGPLTARQREVLRLVAEGRTNREIGRRLGLSHQTVKTHLEHILTKLGAADRTQAAVRAAELGLLDAGRPGARPGEG